MIPATSGATITRLARASQRWMLAGFAVSFAGSTLVQGSLQGLVVSGALAVVLIPIYTTLATLEDLASPLAAKIVARFPAAHVLVACESIDVALSLVTLLAMAVWPAMSMTFMIAYLVGSSALPLFIDLAEEFFAEEVSHVSPEVAAAFTVNIATTSAILAKLVALPLGAGLALLDLRIVVLGNLILSVLAVAFRGLASARFARGRSLALAVGEGATSSRHASSSRNTSDHRLAWLTPLVSPATSAIIGLTRGLYGGYLTLWVGLALGAEYLVPALFCVGLGAVLGPQVAKVIRTRGFVVKGVTLLFGTHAVVGALLAVLASSGQFTPAVIAVILASLVIYTAAPAAATVLVTTHRQLSLSGPAFRSAVGWAHSLSAAGVLLGTWAAMALQMPQDPRPALICAALVAVSLSVWTAKEGGHPIAGDSDAGASQARTSGMAGHRDSGQAEGSLD